MNNIYKIIIFLSIGFIMSYMSFALKSEFVNKFAENLLGLLSTLFAINIATSTLIVGKIREIEDIHLSSLSGTKEAIKDSFIEQIFLIFIAIIFGILRESIVIKCWLGSDLAVGICNTVLFFTFIYYLDIIRDLGLALFQLLDFKEE